MGNQMNSWWMNQPEEGKLYRFNNEFNNEQSSFNTKICFWLTVATYFISGRGASMEVVNANRSSLSSEEFDVLMREIETYIKEHGGVL